MGANPQAYDTKKEESAVKISECISLLDSLMHNTYTDHHKRRWLSNVDGQLQAQLISTHEGGAVTAGLPYGSGDDQKLLLAPPPFDAMYLHYLQAQMHYLNGEIDRYNNAMAMFQAALDDYARHYNRTHLPLGARIRYF